jgi:hypothetical protein
MRRAILGFGLLGTVLFAAALLISFLHPILIEQAAREIVRIEVERRVGEKIEALSNAKVTVLAQKSLGKTDEELDAAKRALAQDLPRKVANVVADMLNADCECRKRLVELGIKAHNKRVSSLSRMRENLVGLIESAYATVSANLMREFRIVMGSNAVAFAMLSLVAYFRRGASLQLFVPTLILAGAVAITGSLYLFNQNWLHTIIYNQYVGFGYAGYLALVSALLADILLNRARITTELVNLFFQAIGSTLQAVPC